MEDALFPYYYDDGRNAQLSRMIAKATAVASLESEPLSESALVEKSRVQALFKCVKNDHYQPAAQATHFIGPLCWEAFMHLVKQKFFHLPHYLDGGDGIAALVMLENHFGRETQRAGCTFMQGCASELIKQVKFVTNPATLKENLILSCAMPITWNTDLVYDLELSLKVPACSMESALADALQGVVAEVRVDGHLFDAVRFVRQEAQQSNCITFAARALSQGIPHCVMPFSKTSVHFTMLLDMPHSADLFDARLYGEARWRTALLTSEQRVSLIQSHIIIEGVPMEKGLRRVFEFHQGKAKSHDLDGANAFVCACMRPDSLNSERSTPPHALICENCSHETITRLSKLLGQELIIELTEEELEIILGDPQSLEEK